MYTCMYMHRERLQTKLCNLLFSSVAFQTQLVPQCVGCCAHSTGHLGSTAGPLHHSFTSLHHSFTAWHNGIEYCESLFSCYNLKHVHLLYMYMYTVYTVLYPHQSALVGSSDHLSAILTTSLLLLPTLLVFPTR